MVTLPKSEATREQLSIDLYKDFHNFEFFLDINKLADHASSITNTWHLYNKK